MLYTVEFDPTVTASQLRDEVVRLSMPCIYSEDAQYIAMIRIAPLVLRTT